MQIIPASNIACPWRVRTVELCTGWFGKGMSLLADLLEPRLAQSHSTVVIPLYKRIVFVRLLNCTEFSGRLSEVAQPLDAISGVQSRVGSRGLGEPWLFGPVGVRGRPGVGQRRLGRLRQFGCRFDMSLIHKLVLRGQSSTFCCDCSSLDNAMNLAVTAERCSHLL